jgi:hypothetical protein
MSGDSVFVTVNSVYIEGRLALHGMIRENNLHESVVETWINNPVVAKLAFELWEESRR